MIPAFNEEKRIGQVLEKLRKEKGISEIIVIDDGSKDKTVEIVKKRRVKVFSNPVNKGKGYSMRHGAKRASGTHVVFFEGDDQLYVDDIRKMREKLKTHDVVIGKRDFSVIPWPRKTNNVLTTFALFLATGKVMRDPVSGFIGINRKKFLDLNLKEDRFNIEAEINFKIARKNLKRAYINERVKYHSRKAFQFNKFSWRSNFLLISYLFKKVFHYED